MFYPDHVVEEVRMGNDIVDVIGEYVSLTRKGGSYFGLCPFHNESTPSFSVSPDKQLYHCFGCGASGNVYSFVMQKENYDFPTAIQFLAERIRYALPETGDPIKTRQLSILRNALYEVHTAAARFYYNAMVSGAGKKAAAYLDERAVLQKARVKFGLGYAPPSWDSLYKHLLGEGFDIEVLLKSGLVLADKKGGYYDRFRDRLMFPILDVQNRVVGFGGRIMSEGEPKYLNSPETPIFEKRKNLYSLNFARQTNDKSLILVEGYMDVISLYQAGIKNAVAALGTAFNYDHVKVLKKYADTVFVLFDSDEAGERAVLRAIPLIAEGGIRTRVVQLEGAKDPDEFIKKFGPAAFKKALAGSLSHIAFQIKALSKAYDITDAGQQIDFTKEVSKVLAGLHSAIELEAYLKEAAEITGISREAIQQEVSAVKGGTEKLKTVTRSFTPHEKKATKQLTDARKGVIYLSANNSAACGTVRKHLEPYEMGDPIYERLLAIIFDLTAKNGAVYPAEIINYFEDPEEHRTVSDIFHTVLSQDDMKGLNQALNDQLKIIKNAYIEMKMADTPDDNELMALMKMKRNIENLNISLKEG